MVNQKLLHDVTYDAITRFVLPKTCYLDNATGNILRFKDKYYIVTCRHVADDFFKNSTMKVLLRDKKELSIQHLKYLNRTKPEIDIAVIEIKDNSIDVDSFKFENFKIIKDLSKTNFQKSNFFFCGYPSAISFNRDDNRLILYMAYMTLPTEDFIYLDYDSQSESNRVIKSDLKLKLPHPGGMSGAFLFLVEAFEGGKEEIWTPNYIKVIGIQTIWNKKTRVRCSNIKYLFELIE